MSWNGIVVFVEMVEVASNVTAKGAIPIVLVGTSDMLIVDDAAPMLMVSVLRLPKKSSIAGDTTPEPMAYDPCTNTKPIVDEGCAAHGSTVRTCVSEEFPEDVKTTGLFACTAVGTPFPEAFLVQLGA